MVTTDKYKYNMRFIVQRCNTNRAAQDNINDLASSKVHEQRELCHCVAL